MWRAPLSLPMKAYHQAIRQLAKTSHKKVSDAYLTYNKPNVFKNTYEVGSNIKTQNIAIKAIA